MAYLHPDLALLLAALFVLGVFIKLYRQIGENNRGFTLSFFGIGLFLLASFFNYFEETPYGYLMLAVTDEAGWDFIVPVFGYAPGGLLFCFGFIEWLKTARQLKQEIEQRENTERELKHALAEVGRASAAKDHFFSAISHELRTPLTAIIGFSEILADDRTGLLTSGQRSEYNVIVKNSGEHLLEIIDALLKIAEKETDHQRLEEEVFDLCALVKESTHMMQVTAQKTNARFQVQGPVALGVLADKRLMRHIILSIFSCALRHCNKGNTLTVRLWAGDDGTPLTVCLTGLRETESLDALRADLLPLQYEGGDTNYPGVGNGIGLTLAARYAHLHEGMVSIDLAGEGKGSAIFLELPAQRQRSLKRPPYTNA